MDATVAGTPPEDVGAPDPWVYREVAEHAGDPLLLSSGGSITWISPSIESTLGWTPDEMSAMPLVQLCYPDDQGGLSALMRQRGDGVHRGVFRMRSKERGFLWVLVSLSTDGRSQTPSHVGSLREINMRVEAEQELVHLVDQYRVLAENSSDVVARNSNDGRVEWISDSVTDLIGWRPEEIVGRSVLEFVHPDDVEGVTTVAEATRGGVPGEFEARVVTTAGDYRWVSVSLKPVFDDTGSVIGRVAGWRDVTKRHQVERRLAESEQQLRAVAESLVDPLVLLEAVRDEFDRVVDFVHVNANEAACRALSLDRAQLIGSRMLDTLPGLASAGLFDAYVGVIDTGVPLALTDFGYADQVGDQQLFYDISGTRAGRDRLTLTWRDVTERKGAAERLASSEERYRLLAQNTADVVVHVRDERIAWISPSVEKALGGAPSEWVGSPLWAVIHPDDLETYASAEAATQRGETVVRRIRLAARDGQYHWIEAHASPFHAADGTLDGFIASARVVDTEVATAAELDRMARFDALTGLLNRGEAVTRLHAVTARQRKPGGEVGLLFCDVDRFKDVNDTYGHAAGDAVLQGIASRISSAVRQEDVVARMGGDELLVILQAVHDLDETLRIAEKIRAAAGLPIALRDGRMVTATLTIGATLAGPGEDADVVMARVDRALYAGKKAGRNQVVSIPAD